MYSILVVENREKWRKIFSQGLKAQGYQVQETGAWEDAVEQLSRTVFDAVVLNLHMIAEKDFLGQHVLAAIVQYNPLTPSIIISGFPSRYKRKIGRYGYQIYELLSKVSDPDGYDLDDLFETVECAIDDRTLVRRLLDLLDDHLSEAECNDAKDKVAAYYNYHPGFQTPEGIAHTTKRQKIGYLVSVLVQNFGPSAIDCLCNAVRGIKPHDKQLQAGLDEFCPSSCPPPPAAAQQEPAWDTEVVRKLLTEALSDQELDRLCYDHFRPAYEEFGQKMGKGDKVHHLVEYCDRQEKLDHLVDLVRQRNPRKYANLASRLHKGQ
ncbi:MAG: hypothetical protein JW850_05120 [Thermoflexales bacterium]|nr:hypothetical protein [Thermoflexales bacterium]